MYFLITPEPKHKTQKPTRIFEVVLELIDFVFLNLEGHMLFAAGHLAAHLLGRVLFDVHPVRDDVLLILEVGDFLHLDVQSALCLDIRFLVTYNI